MPGLIVTYSLIVLFFPIIILFFSPLNLRSCGSVPILAKGKILVSEPIFVFPDKFTCECIYTFSSIETFGPTIEYGPI